jgi:pimeloyl-ACP methyl ester carboxylesterase
MTNLEPVFVHMTSTIIPVYYKDFQFNIASRCRKKRGELIFFIHGLGCAKEHFDDAWSFERLNDYSMMALDLPGFGDSPGHESFSYDLLEHAEVCNKIIDSLPGFRVHVVGHSMGGAVGLLLSDMVRERLESFVNVEGNLISQAGDISRRNASVTFEEFQKKQLPGMILGTAISDEPGMKLWSACIRKSDKRGLYLSSRSLAGWSASGILLEKFMGLACKKIYLYGEANSFMKVLRMLEGIPTACISKSGHFPMNDNPAEFYHTLADFLIR